MKKYSWLNALENLSLVGLGAGSVASLLLQQMLYTTTPLSLLVVLGLLNRRRLAQMGERRDATLAETDQYLALQVDRLHHQVSSMPTPEAFHRLNRTLSHKDQEISEKLQAELTVLKQGLVQRLTAVEQQGLGSLRQEVRQLVDRANYLTENTSQLGADLGELSTRIQTDGVHTTLGQLKQDVVSLQTNLESLSYQTKPNLATLQEQVNRLDRQFSKLPPPIDVSSVKREVGELIKIVADLVPRRDLSSIVNEVQALQQQQEALKHSIVAIETAALNFKRTFHDLPQAELSEASGEIPNLVEMNGNGAVLDQTHDFYANLPRVGSVPSSVYPELQELAANYLGNLRSQLGTIQDFTTQLAQQQKQLREQLNQLPQTLDVVALQRQLTELSQRVPVSEGALEAFKFRIQDVMHQELQYINQQLQTVAATPHSELIFDFQPTAESEATTAGSRAVLEQALETAQNRLILIWPWAEQCQFDDPLFRQLEAFLQRGRQLDIGWCYLAERQEERLLSKMQRNWLTDVAERSMVQDTLHKLLQLKRSYPDQFQFKILGTSENFLVADDCFAVMGITDALKTASPFPELQLKIKTTDAGIIHNLIQRFDDPTIAAEDLTSYWNRAVTRHDLGDKLGAIADYSHILSLNPADPITYNYRGLAYYDSADFASAIADFTTAIQIHPHQVAAYCNRGFIYSEQGDQWAAIEDYTLAIQTCPNDPIAYFYRGITQQKLENHADAVEDYSKTIQLTPDSPVAYYYRGLTWQKLGNPPEAVADFELAAQFFWARGCKTNAQKALKNIAKLRQDMSRERPPVELEATPILY